MPALRRVLRLVGQRDPGEPVHGGLDLAPQGRDAEPDGSSQGSPVSAAVASISGRASASSWTRDVLSATATTLDGATSAATSSWAAISPGRGAIGNRAYGQVVEVVVRHAGLVDQTMAWGVAPWISPRLRCCRRGDPATPGLSTITQSPRASPSSTTTRRCPAGSRRSRGPRRRPSLDHHPGLPVGTERRADEPAACAPAGARGRPSSCRWRRRCPP